MRKKTPFAPIWVIGNSTLAETLNPKISTDIVSYLYDVLEWKLSNEINDVLWEDLGDVNSCHTE